MGYPSRNAVARLLSEFELNRALGLLLHDCRSGRDPVAVANVPNKQLGQTPGRVKFAHFIDKTHGISSHKPMYETDEDPIELDVEDLARRAVR